MNVISYQRVSVDDQVKHGVSLAAQEEKIRQYCNLYGLRIVETISDAGCSAKDLNRVGIKSIIDLVKKKKIDGIVCAKLDRLTRSIRDLSYMVDLFNQKNVALISVSEHIDTSSAAGRMILNMLGVISQWERETIAERTSTALQYKKSQGQKYSSDALYGYQYNGNRLVPVESEQTVIKEILQYHDVGMSFNAIACRLNEAGVLTRSARKWYAKQIIRVIQNSDARQKIDTSYFETVVV